MELLRHDSMAVRQHGLPIFIYVTLLRETVKTTSGAIISEYRNADIPSLFKRFTKKEIQNAVDTLVESGYIEVQGSKYILGKDGDLFVNNHENNVVQFKHEKALKKRLGELSQQFIRGVSKQYYSTFLTLQKKDTLRTDDMVCFYSCVYFAFTEEEPSPFTNKERGQMTQLIKMYGGTNLLKNMVYEYVANSEKYTRNYLSVGGLLLRRQQVYEAVKGVTKKFNTLVEDEDF